MELKLKLDRPLVVFDLETTGVNAQQDRIIELAAIKVMPDGEEIEKCWLLNPGVKIPPETTAIHGITDAIVAKCPTFRDVSDDIWEFFDGCDLSGFNCDRFDIPCLAAEFARLGRDFGASRRRHVDVQRIYHRMEPRDLSAAVRFYVGRDHTGAHGAEADTRATLDVLKAQLVKYEGLPETSAEMDDWLVPHDPLNADRQGMIRWSTSKKGWTINFGKKKGELLKDIFAHEKNFLKWVANGGFDPEVRAICRDLLEHGRLPPRPDAAN